MAEPPTMGRSKKCYFLELPRELRDRIYTNLTANRFISRAHAASDGRPPPSLVLRDAITMAMLLVSHQIHDEYRDTVLSQSKLMVKAFSHERLTLPRDLDLKQSFPAVILRQVKACSIKIHVWGHLEDVIDEYLMESDISPSSNPEQGQTNSEWTPSNALCTKIQSDILLPLSSLLSPQASVRIDILLDGLPDPNDLHQIGQKRYPFKGTADVFPEICDPVTIQSRLTEDKQTKDVDSLPKPKNVTVAFYVTTMLYCTAEDNSIAVKANRQALFDGKKVHVLEPWFVVGREIVLWRLELTEDKSNYRGFRPVFEVIHMLGPG